MAVPYDQGRPIWVDDDSLRHRRTTCVTPRCRSRARGSSSIALTTRVQEQLLDRERPLWEIWFVEGLEDGNVAMIQKTHHSLVDGVSGVDVATLLLDATPRLRAARRRGVDTGTARRARRSCSSTRLRERATEPAEFVRSFRSLLRGPRHAFERAGELGRSMGTMVNRESIAPRTSINARTGRHRLLSVVRVPLADVKIIRKALGGTVNDVVLAGVGGGLNRLLTTRGDDVEDLRLARADPGVGARRRPARRARQQDLGDVRVAARRTTRTRSSGSTRSRSRPPT